MKTMRWIALPALLGSLFLLASCQSALQGSTEDETYYSPRAAYAVPLYLSPFRGQVAVEERCNATGGSTTFWDHQSRFFRIDYLKIDENPMALAPRFASDQTLLNSVMNNYLREVLPTGQSIEDVDTTVREFLKDREPRALFVILNMNINSDREAGERAQPMINLKRLPLIGERSIPLISNQESTVRGTYYYGFLLFKRGEFVYVVQHYQPSFMRDKMLQALTRLADNLVIPGKVRGENELERARERWNSTFASVRLREKPQESEEDALVNPIRPCD